MATLFMGIGISQAQLRGADIGYIQIRHYQKSKEVGIGFFVFTGRPPRPGVVG